MTPGDRVALRDQLTDPQVEGLTAWAEAKGEPLLGMVAVISVIRNRARIKGVRSAESALATAAFSCWLDQDTKDNNQLVAMARLLMGREPLPYDITLFTCLWLAGQHDLQDPTFGATHYYNPDVVAKPAWAELDAPGHPQLTAKIGHHVFFAHVRF